MNYQKITLRVPYKRYIMTELKLLKELILIKEDHQRSVFDKRFKFEPYLRFKFVKKKIIQNRLDVFLEQYFGWFD